MAPLNPSLVDRALDKLQLTQPITADLDGLRRVYDAWCRRVPFDNVQKRIALSSRRGGPLPGDDAASFFEEWLRHGTGGTCWAGNGALCELLRALGFEASRGIGTMLAAPDLPPNHGTVVVKLEGQPWLVDASILTGEPLPLQDGACIEHGAWGVRLRSDGGNWVIDWRPLHGPEGLGCRVDQLDANAEEFRSRHEATRGWSPFNFAVYARLNWGDRVEGTAFGRWVSLDSDGNVEERPVDPTERARLLVEVMGYSEELVSQLPADEPMPPPPKP